MSEFAESLVKQLEEHVSKLKRTHEESKQPITDDVPELRLFCLLLERILRFGQRVCSKCFWEFVGWSDLEDSDNNKQHGVLEQESEDDDFVAKSLRCFEEPEKMTFFGDRKDYWNYLCDCLQGSRALDDSVQAVQRYTHLNTLQGKGRALIRESLVRGNLADMMQVATMAKQTIDWYRPDAIMRDQQLSSMLVSSLYEMNDIPFHLSQAGQELNDNWPSFTKKAFHVSNESTGYSTFGSDVDSIRPRDFDVDTSISSTNTGNIAEPIVTRVRRKGKSGHVSIDTLEKYMKILEESIQIDSSQETNADSGAQSDDLGDIDGRGDQSLPISVKKLQKKLEGWSLSYESQINELETELQHERDEREADQADAENLQQNLKDQLNEFRQAETQLKAKVESLASLLSAKSEESDAKQMQLEDLLMKSKSWEVNSIEWQARLDDAHDEMKSLQEDLNEARQKFNAVEADYTFLCSVKSNLDEKLEDAEKRLADKESLVTELERNFKQSIQDGEAAKSCLEHERELNSELESRLLAAETQVTKLLNDNERRRSYGEIKGEQKQSDISRLHDVTTDEDKMLVGGDSQLDHTNVNLQQNSSGEVAVRSETIRLLEELKTARMKIEELEQTNEDLTRKCAPGDRIVELTESELAQKANALHQLSSAVKSAHQFSEDIDEVKGSSDKPLSQLSKQLFASVQHESVRKGQVTVAQNEVEVLRRATDEEERLQTTETRDTSMDEQQKIWSKVKQDVNITQTSEQVQERSEHLSQLSQSHMDNDDDDDEVDSMTKTISDSSAQASRMGETETETDSLTKNVELEELKQRLNDEEQKRLLTEQECASLKYQMSTDVMQYKQQQDTVKQHQKEISELQKMITESNKKLHDSKAEMMTLKGQRDTAHEEKAKLQLQVSSLEQQLKQLQVEVNSLGDQLLEVTFERDRNRQEVLKLKEELSHIQEQMSLSDKDQIKKIADLKKECEMITEHVVNVAKQKSALWEENMQLQQDLALQLSRTWADESLASHCSNCGTEFSLMTRKHHCRSCGQIFCATCTQHFLMLPSYSKPCRVCLDCFDMINEAKLKGSVSSSSKRQRARTQQSASISSSLREDQAEVIAVNNSITPEHHLSSGVVSRTLVSSDSNSVDVQTADSSVGDVSAELTHNHSSPTKFGDSYAIIDDDDIHKADPSYVPRNRPSLFTGKRKPSSVDDQLTETGPNAPTVTEREWMVEARSRHKISILVIREKTRINWQFTADSTALSFGIWFKKNESEDEGQELIPVKRVTSVKTTQSGELICQRAGIYTLVFDNTTSSSSSRKVSYRVEVIKAYDI